MKVISLKLGAIEDVAEIEKACFAHPWTAAQIEEYYNNPNAYFFTAIEEDRVVGYIGTYMVMDECFITNVAVLPDYRGHGIGRALVERATTNAMNNGASFITLEVRTSNSTAIKIYEENGFFREGVRPGFYRDPDEDAIIMTRRFKN